MDDVNEQDNEERFYHNHLAGVNIMGQVKAPKTESLIWYNLCMAENIYIKRTAKKGLGVFAARDIKKGEIVESAPVLVFTPKDRKNLEKTPLSHYIYPWRSTRGAALAFGYGSIYNHSYSPNADWKQNFKTQSMVYRAIKDIKKDEETTVNYNGEPDEQTPIDWFEVR